MGKEKGAERRQTQNIDVMDSRLLGIIWVEEGSLIHSH